MAQVCDICGKGPQFGNNISHAHNVTRRRWSVNLQAVKALVNGASKRIRVCTGCIKNGKNHQGVRLFWLPALVAFVSKLIFQDWRRPRPHTDGVLLCLPL